MFESFLSYSVFIFGLGSEHEHLFLYFLPVSCFIRILVGLLESYLGSNLKENDLIWKLDIDIIEWPIESESNSPL